MISIKKCPVPANTLLDRYSTDGAYADCYGTEIPERVALPEFVFTFYTTPLFKLERFILKLLVAKPSTDIQARELAQGSYDTFAAWHVEARGENELLMCDFPGRTRSWLKIAPIQTVSRNGTQLYFGSAVVPKRNPKTGDLSIEFGYRALLGFHQIYSVLLLYSAKRRLQHRIRSSYESQDPFHR
jgi:hypothetical protein